MAEDLNDDWWEERPAGKQDQQKEGKGTKRTQQESEDEEEVDNEHIDNSSSGSPTLVKDESAQAPTSLAPKLTKSDQKIKRPKKGKSGYENPALEQRAKLNTAAGAADVFWSTFQSYAKENTSAAKLHDYIVTEQHFVQPQLEYTGDWHSIGAFIKKACPKALQPDVSLRKHHPRRSQFHCGSVLILCASAIRGCDIIRGLADVRGNTMIGKFFAKHMKYQQQVKFMNQHAFSIAVGTPGRVTKLAAEAGLDFTDTLLVVIDYSFLDVKNRNIFQVSEVRADLLELLKERILSSLH